MVDVFDKVYILFHFNIVLKHNWMSSTNINLKFLRRSISPFRASNHWIYAHVSKQTPFY
jgi:hypothetical protein